MDEKQEILRAKVILEGDKYKRDHLPGKPGKVNATVERETEKN